MKDNKKIDGGEVVGVATSFIGSANNATIFSMFYNIKEVTLPFLMDIGKYIFFPIAAASEIIQMMLAWRQAYRQKGKSGTLLQAVVETLAALAITTAVVGSLAFEVIFGAIAPMIFVATLGAKALYQGGLAAYFLGKASMSPAGEKKDEYLARAKTHVKSAIVFVGVTIAVATVMIAGKVAFAAFGIAAGVMGAVFAAKTFYDKFVSPNRVSPKPEHNAIPQSIAPGGSTLRVGRRITLTRTSSEPDLSKAVRATPAASTATPAMVLVPQSLVIPAYRRKRR